MTAVLLIIVLTSVCVLHAGADIPIQPDFDAKQFAGKWYPIALVMDQEALKDVDVHDSTAEPSASGDIVLKARYFLDGVCESFEIHLSQTDEPGKFTSFDGTSTIRFVEVDYASYCIFHVTTEDNHNVLHLYSRDPQVSDAVKEKYMNHVTSMQFPAEKIHYEKRTGQCPD